MALSLCGEVYYSVKTLAVQGTGSYPQPPQGWQRISRFSAIHPPFTAPYFDSASIAYWLHDGLNRQDGGRMRLGPSCQARAIQMSGYFTRDGSAGDGGAGPERS